MTLIASLINSLQLLNQFKRDCKMSYPPRDLRISLAGIQIVAFWRRL